MSREPVFETDTERWPRWKNILLRCGTVIGLVAFWIGVGVAIAVVVARVSM
ncbi:MAG: hypothetical protein P4M11_06550 [Candidatus Pacebacteria bacterium]|nr:hypothetical protein [Candidatus Paceibacterota bacterium]